MRRVGSASGFSGCVVPEIPEGFRDESWGNDVCPRLSHEIPIADGLGSSAEVSIWVDRGAPFHRYGMGARYVVTAGSWIMPDDAPDYEGEILAAALSAEGLGDYVIAETDDWGDALAAAVGACERVARWARSVDR